LNDSNSINHISEQKQRERKSCQTNESETTNAVNKERLKQLAVSETGFIFDPQSGQSFSVNQTGHLVIDMLKRSESPQAAAQELAVRCEKPYELTLCAVEAFMMQLARYL
jgi:hypothetical protein